MSLSDETIRPQSIQVNFDNSLECLLREIHFITSSPLNYEIPSKFRELIPILQKQTNIR